MKIGIITCGLESNYGACLQACATQYAVNNLGHEAFLMNYSFMGDKPYRLFSQPTVKSKISGILFYRLRKALWYSFDSFRKKYMRYSPYKLYTCKDFDSARKDYDVFLIGSDQVWNPELGIDNKITLLSFYQGNSPRKISYASSFGISELPDIHKTLYSDSLNDFECISVREESGKKIINDLLDKECSVVADPVMLLTSHEWEKFVDNSRLPQKPYVFIYDMRHSKDVQSCALKIASDLGCDVYVISSVHIFRKGIKNIYGASPAQYLSLIKNAKYVVTDSFHGTVFSILFNKDFYSFCSKAGMKIGGRLTNILKKMDLSDRLCTEFNSSIEASHIDYSEVNKKIDSFRKESLTYLREAIKG